MALTVAHGPDAENDLLSVQAYWAGHSPAAANRTIAAIANSILLLTEHPNSGRAVLSAPYREKPVPQTPYIILYRVVGDTLVVLRILHGRMDRPYP